MKLLAKVGNFLTGGFLDKAGSKLLDTVFPDKLTDEEKLIYDAAVRKDNQANQVELLKIAAETDAEFNRRIASHEGTAKDLKSIPFVGPILITLRGMQRPTWSFGALYFDYKYFTGGIELSEQGTSLLFLINALVLGFLFGERAIKNVLPMVNEFLGKRNDTKT